MPQRSIRFPDDLTQDLEHEAQRLQRSFSWVVINACREHAETTKPPAAGTPLPKIAPPTNHHPRNPKVMTKVYAVGRRIHDVPEVEAIFSTEQAAQDYVTFHELGFNPGAIEWNIETFVIDLHAPKPTDDPAERSPHATH